MADVLPAASLRSRFEPLLPPESLGAATAAYAVDGCEPLLVLRPGSVAEVQTALAAAGEAGTAVIPWGGGRHMGLGRVPARYDIALDLTRLDRVVAYEPADLTITVEAGARLSQIESTVAARGQTLGLEAAAGSTVGGVLAANVSGPSRLRYGTARDLVIGMSVVTADGALVKSGGRVVKNVAGYDMAKLHIGALGTLGVIVEVTLRLFPRSEASLARTYRGDFEALVTLARRIAGATLPASQIVLRMAPGEHDACLDLRLDGGEPTLDRAEREVATIASQLGLTDVGDAASVPDGGTRVRIGALPSILPTLCNALTDAGAALVAYPTVGIAYGTWESAPPAGTLLGLRERCIAAGGYLVLESAAVELKREVDIWGPPPPGFNLMQRLKSQFDPAGVLNPGRYTGGL